MSTVLYLEPVGGISGDMFLAAMLDLGVDGRALEQGLRTLGLDGWGFEVTSAVRQAISGVHLNVEVSAEVPHVHRALSEILERIEASAMPPRAKAQARAVFEVIGRAEAKIHDVPLESVHFHEVGAIDSIVDVCGAALALELLGQPEVFSAPPPLGSGMVETMHGRFPVPVPATLEILRDLPVRFEGQGELTTPTGAALLRALSRPGPPPPMRLQRTGYGLGRRELPDRPNVLRATLGTPVETSSPDVWELAVTLDDATPQLLGYLVETLLGHGALDAWVAPVTLKKSRPGHVLSVLVSASEREQVVRRLLSESPTLGVRAWPVQRTVLDRAHVEVETAHGPVRVKVGSLDGETLNAAPEYEDVRARAEAAGVPFKQVWAEALAAYARRR
ncbi:MAG TPA: nickel pincer cofactor biosynthesis protein LarC [Myxococcaceae bacterium]|nr:nickel pincer cofactor biosynthesis protein LarC [Myxococcaceae bacterium]